MSIRKQQNGKLKGIGSFKDGKPEGEWKTYHENGELERIGSVKDGKRQGDWKYFHENGKKRVLNKHSIGR